MSIKNYSPAFSIVELIIAIAILAVLATISFISFNGYSSSSRDSVRITDMAGITSWLNQYIFKQWLYPMPEWTVSSWTINGKEVAYKWEIRDNISRIAGISKTPVDPLTKWYYTYGVSFNGKYFQIWVTLEDSNSVSYNNLINTSIALRSTQYEDNGSIVISSPSRNPFLSLFWDNYNTQVLNNKLKIPFFKGITDNVYADSSSSNNYSTKVSGNYLWIIKFSTWTYTYLSNIPSLIFNFSGNTNPSGNLLTWSLTYYVIDKNNNYPYKLVDSMNINNKDGNTILRTLTNNSWATLTWVDISSIVNSTGTVGNVFSGSVLSSFWYGVNVIGNVVGSSSFVSSLNVVNNNCTWTTYSWYTISTLNNWSSQTFYKTITGWTWSLQATCTNTTLSYWAESISCSSWYTQNGSVCSPINCNSIKTTSPSSLSWIYLVKPDSNPAFQVYCDMSTDWWGRSILGNWDSRSSDTTNFMWEAGYWTVWIDSTNRKLTNTQISSLWNNTSWCNRRIRWLISSTYTSYYANQTIWTTWSSTFTQINTYTNNSCSVISSNVNSCSAPISVWFWACTYNWARMYWWLKDWYTPELSDWYYNVAVGKIQMQIK